MKKLPNLLQLSVVLILVVTLIFLHLWQTWRVIYLQRQVSQTEETLTPLRERKKDLQIKVAQYFSYERIERIAKERLKMVEPEITAESESED